MVSERHRGPLFQLQTYSPSYNITNMYDILDGLASNQDAVSSVFLGAVRNGPDLHCIFLEPSYIKGFSNYAKRRGVVTFEEDLRS